MFSEERDTCVAELDPGSSCKRAGIIRRSTLLSNVLIGEYRSIGGWGGWIWIAEGFSVIRAQCCSMKVLLLEGVGCWDVSNHGT